ncbi:hypothetical protein HH310_41845 [Actinoplanes sp. TBRC 11911]|uniref:DUF6518 family protein n=1 Tax=Actinoplanes sp. TBRC 11911 TaxID=2729386 RepID=UPI00145FB647|nr:DUF6518 family protein [Actinoplanes sp. TBRC 11911]NMO57695.1 hypothetical protein [Actinoplanes sp. TBRC 11911]
MIVNSRVSVTAPIAGFLLGFLDFVWIKFMPSLVAGLGNSGAVWAIAAFLLTFYHCWSLGRALPGAALMLVVAVPSYYVAAALIQYDSWSNAGNSTSLLWMTLAVITGIAFGLGGVVARRPGPLRLPARGLPAAVLLAELLLDLDRVGDPNYRTTEVVSYALVLSVLAVLITVVVARR